MSKQIGGRNTTFYFFPYSENFILYEPDSERRFGDTDPYISKPPPSYVFDCQLVRWVDMK
jgi:hypothetical protein